jgi:hypothetical protein
LIKFTYDWDSWIKSLLKELTNDLLTFFVNDVDKILFIFDVFKAKGYFFNGFDISIFLEYWL